MAQADLIARLSNLDEAPPDRRLKLFALFGDQPEVLDLVRQAREAGKSFPWIAEQLTSAGQFISPAAVQNWLRSEGID